MKLIPITAEVASRPEVKDSDFLSGLCIATLSLYPEGIPEMPWAGYLAEENGMLVGTCAFKTPPVSGRVEIAYFTFPGFEGRGVATRMARNLIALTEQHGVTQVKAQTLPETNASAWILKKLGFKRIGTVHHPEDGDVWEWQLDNS
ncbi:MAG TPA: GNAT family protein [Noviherbaspirillum sp.]|uniref:GNAT family N-acetyltransferase n=1 Tax=Noviherbaspirillum sp. TaxID=1926288 RepID=UPI002D310828|nr:GNAT family protein [Noviherbaspirillum sp.]HYD96562.1 GNAT family protein [Noviherbaspirillum sp.]